MTLSFSAWALDALTAFALGMHAQAPKPVIAGQGPGIHDPRSAFKSLEEREEREGVVSWKLLTAVKTKTEMSRVVPS